MVPGDILEDNVEMLDLIVFRLAMIESAQGSSQGCGILPISERSGKIKQQGFARKKQSRDDDALNVDIRRQSQGKD